MTADNATPSGCISDSTVENAITALRARLRETRPGTLLTRPLHRSQVAELLTIVLNYQALCRRKESK